MRAVISLGASLGITTTAEGVETASQFDQLRAEGCDEIQGYLFSPPVPVRDVAALLSRKLNAGSPEYPAEMATAEP